MKRMLVVVLLLVVVAAIAFFVKGASSRDETPRGAVRPVGTPAKRTPAVARCALDPQKNQTETALNNLGLTMRNSVGVSVRK